MDPTLDRLGAPQPEVPKTRTGIPIPTLAMLALLAFLVALAIWRHA